MLNTAQLQTFLLFPVRDAVARKNFLVACLVMLANFIVPILPMLALMGYIARIMRQVIDENREPVMPAWDDWNGFINDGLRIWGFRIVLSMPLMIVFFGGMGIYLFTALVSALSKNPEDMAPLLLVGTLVFMLTMGFFFIVGIPFGVASLVGSCHVVARRSFSAGFAFKEWWPILRQNFAGFIIYYLIAMAVSYALVFVVQILFITIIFFCIFPFVIPILTAYMLLIQDTLFARAYAEGRAQLTAAAENANA
jgi:hypothetical protein